MTSSVILLFFLLQASHVKPYHSHVDMYDEGSSLERNWQSPILIRSAKTTTLGLPALECVGYHDLLPEKLVLENTGTTVELSIPKCDGCNSDMQAPYIFGGPLNYQYEFEQFHFHWGSRNDRGSEHILNEVKYPMEMHLVHRNKKYPTVQEALNYPDGLAVLAVFFQLRERNYEPLDFLIQYFSKIKSPETKITLPATFELSAFLPDTDIFYTYKGSLTTAPFSEVVTWLVFPEPLPMSFFQINQFRTLLNKTNEKLADNFRELQPLGFRSILIRRPGFKRAKEMKDPKFYEKIWFNENLCKDCNKNKMSM